MTDPGTRGSRLTTLATLSANADTLVSIADLAWLLDIPGNALACLEPAAAVELAGRTYAPYAAGGVGLARTVKPSI